MKISLKDCKCNICNEPAVIWYQNRWWCSFCSAMGDFNMKGYCKNAKVDDNNSK